MNDDYGLIWGVLALFAAIFAFTYLQMGGP